MRAVHRVARSEGAGVLTTKHFQTACTLEGIDEFGLDPQERTYLALLMLATSPIQPTALAAQLELPLTTIQGAIEPFLLRLGFIERVPGGRRLTDRGRAYAAKGPADNAFRRVQ
jgi:Holliday junction resolvasome RuvABC ATP-dependent DNA helicase subunit